jgi:hypothetical protein
MSAEIRCLVCGGRGGWWGADGDPYRRAVCSHCDGTGWEPNSSPSLIALCAPYQDHDGFTPGRQS